jgi:hypothetical protein
MLALGLMVVVAVCAVSGKGYYLQGDRKVTQPILKFVLMIAIQYNSI